jgi:hypothetical protein
VFCLPVPPLAPNSDRPVTRETSILRFCTFADGGFTNPSRVQAGECATCLLQHRITQFLCPNLSELASRVRDSCDRGDWSATKSRKVLVCSPQTGIPTQRPIRRVVERVLAFRVDPPVKTSNAFVGYYLDCYCSCMDMLCAESARFYRRLLSDGPSTIS